MSNATCECLASANELLASHSALLSRVRGTQKLYRRQLRALPSPPHELLKVHLIPSPPPSPTLHDTLEGLTLEELRELGEDQGDDDVERIVEQFRQQRLAELNRLKHARFGRVYPIGRDDYTREVTEASKVDQDEEFKGKGTGVVCFLYKDG